ncbi:unnamed protein product [Brassica rapa]|uniref:Uncharacterized protein n=1 Tax=Brassica campestris TaxID=3711 RepID=A0A8D9M465_BRACM|nr:unnamed protein product [Brassica rapa]
MESSCSVSWVIDGKTGKPLGQDVAAGPGPMGVGYGAGSGPYSLCLHGPCVLIVHLLHALLVELKFSA